MRSSNAHLANTQAGERWIDETRGIAVAALDADAGYWALDFTTGLRNVKGAALHIGSPTTEGRPLAGYGGLFWRGPRSFDRGEIITAAGHNGPEAMGQPAAWLAYRGRHDGNGSYRRINPRLPRPSRQFALSQLLEPGSSRPETTQLLRTDHATSSGQSERLDRSVG